MNFEYTQIECREPVAYIDHEDDLVIKDKFYNGKSILLRRNNKILEWSWQPAQAKKLLYRGDKITITL